MSISLLHVLKIVLHVSDRKLCWDFSNSTSIQKFEFSNHTPWILFLFSAKWTRTWTHSIMMILAVSCFHLVIEWIHKDNSWFYQMLLVKHDYYLKSLGYRYSINLIDRIVYKLLIFVPEKQKRRPDSYTCNLPLWNFRSKRFTLHYHLISKTLSDTDNNEINKGERFEHIREQNKIIWR